jgi:hypothetical protein
MWFEEDKTGYLYTGAFIGSIVGLVLSGLLSDSINKLMIRLNHGKYEPEFRILLVIPQLVFCGIGLYGFGWTADDVMHYGWLLPDVFFAFLIAGMVMGAVAASLYIVDAHRMWTTRSCVEAIADSTRRDGHRGIYLHAGFQKHVQLCPDVLRLYMVCPRRHQAYHDCHR